MDLPTLKKKRIHQRFRADNALALVETANVLEPHSFQTENISQGGLFIRGDGDDYRYSVGSRLVIHLFLGEQGGGESVPLQTEIAHVVAPNGFGLRILDEHDENLASYSELLADYIGRFPERLQPTF